ncbi:LexA family protein [Candidatus Odyssella thessalonicensis]|uniref:LexA family protein n=1 Tax=Candidatus Odyssella thessalonicensis TaxID=84647 RepID=UPI000225B1F7|nr:translesion error-prone DNA polymerase V autoproteolytic subunit [Candidatus Odyssella thessalonicensis]
MARGGSRAGAGRKKNSGLFGEKTVARRIPESLASALDNYLSTLALTAKGHENVHSIFMPPIGNMQLPFFSSKVAAGLPDRADDHQEALDLHSHLIPSPASSFVVQVSGDSMIEAGICSDDILIVNREITPKDGHIVIASVNGEITVKQLLLRDEKVVLMPANPHYAPLNITQSMDFRIWGVVTSVVHHLTK